MKGLLFWGGILVVAAVIQAFLRLLWILAVAKLIKKVVL